MNYGENTFNDISYSYPQQPPPHSNDTSYGLGNNSSGYESMTSESSPPRSNSQFLPFNSDSYIPNQQQSPATFSSQLTSPSSASFPTPSTFPPPASFPSVSNYDYSPMNQMPNFNQHYNPFFNYGLPSQWNLNFQPQLPLSQAFPMNNMTPNMVPQQPQKGQPVLATNDNAHIVTHRVPGRLGLINDNKLYRVTVAELDRRISEPEGLNVSYLSGLLRKGKGKATANKIREDLGKCGLAVPENKRILAEATCFTALTEEESIKTANDAGTLMSEYFKPEIFEKKMTEYMTPHLSIFVNTIIKMTEAMEAKDQTLAQELMSIFFGLISHVASDVFESDPSIYLQSNDQLPDKNDVFAMMCWNMNLASHNFLVFALKSTFEVFQYPDPSQLQ